MKARFLIWMILFTGFAYSQEISVQARDAPPVMTADTAKIVLLKPEVFSTKIIHRKFCMLYPEGTKSDTISLGEMDSLKFPSDCKIRPFVCRHKPLYCISWTENKLTNSDTISQNSTISHCIICDLKAGKSIFSNVYTVTEISEIVHLGHTDATETRQKIRREGLEFSLSDDGSFTLSNKTQHDHLVFDPEKDVFVYENAEQK